MLFRSIIVPYLSSRRKVPNNAKISDIITSNGSVVAFEYPAKIIGGYGSFVVIDQLSGNIPIGKTFVLYQNINQTASSFIKEQLPETSKKVALVYIVDSTAVAAVGYVINNIFEVRIGDAIGPG